jgi:transcription initiation factor TFIIE subunit beta
VQSKHEVRTKQQLISLIRKFPEGISVEEVRDTYPKVLADVESLRQEGSLWALPHHDSNVQMLYPREFPPVITVSSDVASLWHEIEVTLVLLRYLLLIGCIGEFGMQCV